MIRNVILAIILVCQLGVWFVIDNPWSEEKARSEEVVTRKLENVRIDEARRIEVTEPSVGSLRLAQRDGIWCIEDEQGYPAIQAKVRDALTALTTLDRADFRTDKPFLFEDLGVTEAKARHLKIMNAEGQVLSWLLVGKRDIQSNGGTFVRKMGEDAVFVAPEKNFDVLFDVVSRNWYAPGVWDFEVSDQQRVTDLKVAVHRVEIEGLERLERGQSPDERNRFRFVFEAVARDPSKHKEAYWRVIEPEDKADLELDDLIVRAMVSSMLNMRTNEIVARGLRPEFELSDPEELEAKVTMHFREGETETVRALEIGALKANVAGTQQMPVHYLRVSHPGNRLQQAFVHTISRSYLNLIQRPVEGYVNESKRQQNQPQNR